MGFNVCNIYVFFLNHGLSFFGFVCQTGYHYSLIQIAHILVWWFDLLMYSLEALIEIFVNSDCFSLQLKLMIYNILLRWWFIIIIKIWDDKTVHFIIVTLSVIIRLFLKIILFNLFWILLYKIKNAFKSIKLALDFMTLLSFLLGYFYR